MNHEVEPSNAAGATKALWSLHTKRGDPVTILEQAMAAHVGAEWAIALKGEAALAQQLQAILGSGMLRIDARLPLQRDLLHEAGFATASLEGDWSRSRALWMLEPEPEEIKRAQAGAQAVIVDITLSLKLPAEAKNADLWVVHQGAAVTGFEADDLAFVFGKGKRPQAVASAPSNGAAAQALRDVATLPIRLGRIAQMSDHLMQALPGRLAPLGGTAFLLPAGSLPSNGAPLGGVVPAVRSTAAGVILTVGMASVSAVRAMLPESMQTAAPAAKSAQPQPKPAPQAKAAPQPQQPSKAKPAAQAQPKPETTPEKEKKSAAPAQPLPDTSTLLLADVPTEGQATALVEHLDARAKRVYNGLCAWRDAEAMGRNVSRFFVASNATLAKVAEAMPKNDEELRPILGEARQKIFGAALLKALHKQL